MFLKISKVFQLNNSNKIDTKNYTKSESALRTNAKIAGGVGFQNSFFIQKYENINFTFSNFMSKPTASTLDSLFSKIGKLSYLFLDFAISGNSSIIFSILALSFVSTKLYTVLKKMLSHEKSKKLYFLMYIVAVAFILAQCLVLVTSSNSEVSDQGILLLYIYVTATLMLFLIFLALTTCESYLYKELDTKEGFGSVGGRLTTLILTALAFYLYAELTQDIVDIYNIKHNIIKNEESEFQTFSNFEMVGDGYKNSIFYNIDYTNGTWSVFESLKFDIIDSYGNYLMSAVLQTGTLLLVILSLVI